MPQIAATWLRSAGNCDVDVSEFRESYFPDQWAAIKDRLEQIRGSCEPDVIFTHWRDDRHQDHRVVSDLTDVECVYQPRSRRRWPRFPTIETNARAKVAVGLT